eukprot:4355981-Pleurochrysis_carterae.AAC.1
MVLEHPRRHYAPTAVLLVRGEWPRGMMTESGDPFERALQESRWRLLNTKPGWGEIRVESGAGVASCVKL